MNTAISLSTTRLNNALATPIPIQYNKDSPIPNKPYKNTVQKIIQSAQLNGFGNGCPLYGLLLLKNL